MAKGDVINFIGADDYYFSKDTLLNVFNGFNSNSNIDAVYGDIKYFGNSRYKRQWIVGKYEKNSFLEGFQIPFPSFFFKKKLIDFYGNIDEKIDISDDFDLIFRFVHVKKINIYYINKFLVNFYSNGRSSFFLSRLKTIKEIYMIFKKYNLKINFIKYLFKRYLNKLNQIIF